MKESMVQGPGSKVRKALILLCVTLYFASSYAHGATRPAAEQGKIDWLLKEIGNSRATFIRNGKEYDAARAVDHLKFKLLWAGRRVQTARQFIVGVASRSQETGKPYEIRLSEGRQMPFEEWLLERLAVYEKGESARKQPAPNR